MFKPSGLVLNQVVVDYEHFQLEINIPYLLITPFISLEDFKKKTHDIMEVRFHTFQ